MDKNQAIRRIEQIAVPLGRNDKCWLIWCPDHFKVIFNDNNDPYITEILDRALRVYNNKQRPDPEDENRIVIRRAVGLGDWYVITYADGEYLSDACVEGSAADMLAIAKAIRRKDRFFGTRCAVIANKLYARFYSPRNSEGHDARVDIKYANELADQIEQELGSNSPENKQGQARSVGG